MSTFPRYSVYVNIQNSQKSLDRVYRQEYNRLMSEIRLQVSNLLNYTEAAYILGITRATIYAMIKRGELHPIAIADRRYLLQEEIDRLKNGHLYASNADG